jgi:hypothetical protein
MNIIFSGLCVFGGWKGDGQSANPIQVILTKSERDHPHLPMIAIPSNDVSDLENPAPFSFVGPGEIEFLGWPVDAGFKLPASPAPNLTLNGTNFLLDLGGLSEQAGGSAAIDPASPRIAFTWEIARGSLTASLALGEQPDWNVVNAAGREFPGSASGAPITIADRVVFDPNVTAAKTKLQLGGSAVTVLERADIWVTNLSQVSQLMREEVRVPGERDRLSDVAMHYELLASPPPEDARLIPILHKAVRFFENSRHCIKEMCRVA